jgi:hypothetical protein
MMRPLTAHQVLALSVGHNPAQVAAYMAAELARAPKQSLLWPWFKQLSAMNRWMVLNFMGLTLPPCAVAFVLAAVIAASTRTIYIFSSEPLLWSVYNYSLTTMVVAVVAGVACTATHVLCEYIGDIHMRGPARWEEQSLKEYLMSAPKCPPSLKGFDDALAYSVPGATAIVHVLKQDDHILDPVLEIRKQNASGQSERRFPLIWGADGTIVEL